MPEVRLEPRGAVLRAFTNHDPELLVDGPAGTGKSFGLLWLLHLRALRYPGSRHLMLRKYRASLTQAALVTWQTEIRPDLYGVRFTAEKGFRYPNRSVVVVGGLDVSSKVMSTQYDTIYVQEATELQEGEWEDASTRCRNGMMPYQQLYGDCNPGPDRHWLKQRWERGTLTRLPSVHEDNPSLYHAGAYTDQGRAYLARLDALSGVRKQRLRHGLWVSAEGMVYEDTWQARLHCMPRFAIPRSWPRYLAIDFGYTNPFVCQWWAQDPDGRLYRYRELYMSKRLVEDHARAIKVILETEPPPRAIVCDHDAEGRATLERYLRLSTKPAYKAIRDGIQAVAARLRVAGDGKPRLFLLAGSLLEVDPDLAEGRQPTCTEDEMESYIWDTRNGRKGGEEPLDKDNHGNDSLRYLVAFVDNIGRERKTFRGASAGERPVVSGYQPR